MSIATCPKCESAVTFHDSVNNRITWTCENGHAGVYPDEPQLQPEPYPLDDDPINPAHYSAGAVETIDGIKAALGDGFADFCRGQVLKYIWRMPHKGNAAENAKKAQWYLDRLIAELQKNPP